jgi:tetratricopeptide (TPR) repeat protein
MDSQAKSTLDHALRLARPTSKAAAGAVNPFASAAIPARYALERQQWAAAAELQVVASDAPHVEAMTRFARAIGAARSGHPAAAVPEIERLAALRERALAMKDAYWAEIIDIQRRGARAWLLFAQGKQDEAIEAMRAAADAEDATDKSAVTPGPLAPARVMLGFMLLEAGNAQEALVAFDAAIAKEPNRFLALYGAGRAAEKTRETLRAKRYYDQIATICKDAPAERPELAYARKMAS